MYVSPRESISFKLWRYSLSNAYRRVRERKRDHHNLPSHTGRHWEKKRKAELRDSAGAKTTSLPYEWLLIPVATITVVVDNPYCSPLSSERDNYFWNSLQEHIVKQLLLMSGVTKPANQDPPQLGLPRKKGREERKLDQRLGITKSNITLINTINTLLCWLTNLYTARICWLAISWSVTFKMSIYEFLFSHNYR